MRAAVAVVLGLAIAGCVEEAVERPATPPPREDAGPSPEALLDRSREVLASLGTFGADVRTVVVSGDSVWEGEGLLRLQRPDKAAWTVMGGVRPHLARTDGRYVWTASPEDQTYAVQLPPDDPGLVPERLRLPLAGWLFYGGGLEGGPGRAWGARVEGPLATVGEEVVGGEPCWRVDGWLRLGDAEGQAGRLSVWFAKGDGLIRRALVVVGQADTEGWDPGRLAATFSAQGSSEEVYRRLEADALYPLMTFRFVVPRDYAKVEIPWAPPAGGPTGGLVALQDAVTSATRGRSAALTTLEFDLVAGEAAGRVVMTRGEEPAWDGGGELPDTLLGRLFASGEGAAWPPLAGLVQRPGWLLHPDEEVAGVLCYQVESWWEEEAGASRLRLWISQDDLLLRRAELTPGPKPEEWPEEGPPDGWEPSGPATVETYSGLVSTRPD